MDGDLFRFICREVALAWRSEAGETKLGDWQSTFDGLLSWELRHGMPHAGGPRHHDVQGAGALGSELGGGSPGMRLGWLRRPRNFVRSNRRS